jgi:hypothetical protein
MPQKKKKEKEKRRWPLLPKNLLVEEVWRAET